MEGRASSMAKECVDPGFSILVETAEQNGWTFNGMISDADKDHRRFYPRWIRQNLGRHPHSYGDYSIFGAFGSVAIERKSKEDAIGTILGWQTGWESDRHLPGRRDRFEQELDNLNRIECAVVVVEATLGQCIRDMPSPGKKSEAENGKIFFRTVISYQQRFPNVQWAFCDDKEWAEVYAFRYLHRYFKKHKQEIQSVASSTKGSIF